MIIELIADLIEVIIKLIADLIDAIMKLIADWIDDDHDHYVDQNVEVIHAHRYDQDRPWLINRIDQSARDDHD